MSAASSSTMSWKEIRQAVRKSNRRGAGLGSRIPHMFRIQLDSTGRRCRVYFLCVPAGQRDNTILYVDYDLTRDDGADDDGGGGQFETWRGLLDMSQVDVQNGREMSREEELLRERKRIRQYGITAYDYQTTSGCDAGSHFVFCAANSLFTCTDKIAQSDPVSSNMLSGF